ncbi:peptide synthetase [Nocardia mangyaensis]|uniref:Peptide synthetase n=1 Tax=Nocardia mangyaensis TaxID=2213200 RepID=A0A1J0VTW4_9NOCA|nr:amino acid adenylation domain-containing protein [Nocardia mangyaensis]APE35375.1 peptide synthetase [Nocardia mangyaensis]
MTQNSILDHFRQQVAEQPNARAVVGPRQHLTYQDLDELSDRLAARLRQRHIPRGSLVPIVAHRSFELVIAALAVIKIGAAYVPIDRRYPAARRRRIIDQCRAPLVLATASDPDEVAGAGVLDVDAVIADADTSGFRPATVASADSVYVIFTSGTTGEPKGVIVEHHSLRDLVAWHNTRFAMRPECRSTLLGGPSFDVTQWEIWSPLAAGASLHLLDEATRSDPVALLRFYADHHITHAYVPTVLVPALVDTAVPDGLALRYLFCAGEALHPLATHHLPYTLVDYYGPTEATIFATYRVVEPHSEDKPPSIGVPIMDTEAFILDDNLDEVPEGGVGELCLAGNCLARGYLDPALTAERFIRSVKLGRRLYRTGDLARRLPDATIQFLGRRDDQVKIRGNRVELGDVEAALLRHPLLKAAAVLADTSTGDAVNHLVAFIVLRDASSSDEAVVAAVRAAMRHELPDYMLPSLYRCLTALPTTLNGKIDRSALRHLIASSTFLPSPTAFDDEVEASVATVWRELLGHGQFTATDNFFDVGGHSLIATALVRRIGERLGTRTYIRDIYESPSVRGLAAVLRQRLHSEQATLDSEPIHQLQEDVWLPSDLDFGAGFDHTQLTAPRHIMLTGATGFIGVHLLARLLDTCAAMVHCPVRGIDAADRLRQVATRYRVPITDWQRVMVYTADLAEPHLGLPRSDYDTLSQRVDLIHHCASAVNFIQPYSHMKRDNVAGLRHVIAFAAHQRVKPLILSSTISVYSWGHLHTHKTVMHEADDIDQNLPAVSTDLGYVRSKWVMEKIADLAAAQGLPLMTFRLGYATCHSATGQCADYQWWGRMVKTCIALQAIPDLRNLREGLTTVDYMVSAISEISKQSSALGKKFNLIPSPERNVTLQAFFGLLSKHFGYTFAVLPFRQWVGLWANDSQAPLYPLLSMFEDNVFNGRTTVELYQDTYLWDCRNVDLHLADSDIREPDFNHETLARYLRHLLVEPYLPTES